jgi:hypothetical protein
MGSRLPGFFLHPNEGAEKSPPTVEAVEGTKREIRGLSVRSSLNISRPQSIHDCKSLYRARRQGRAYCPAEVITHVPARHGHTPAHPRDAD